MLAAWQWRCKRRRISFILLFAGLASLTLLIFQSALFKDLDQAVNTHVEAASRTRTTVFDNDDHTNHQDSSRYSIRPEHRKVIPLTELTRSNDVFECPSGQVYVPDTVSDPKLVWKNGRKIPRIIHVTAKSRCMAPEFAQVLDAWRFPDHSFFFHDDQAMEELLHREWAEFPSLKSLLRCFQYGGAMKADVWRLLVMWEYGGIYTDIDNRPNNFNGQTLQPDEEGFFLIERILIPSQWFFAISPRHPMIYHCIQVLIANLIKMMTDTGYPKIVWTTGPGIIRDGFQMWSRRRDSNVRRPGIYTGRFGHTVRLEVHGEWVQRSVWANNNVKAEIMKRSNMTHLTKFGLKENNISCVETMYEFDKHWSFKERDPMYW